MENTLTLATMEAAMTDMARSIDTVWVLLAAALVFFMQAGFAPLP